MRLSFKEYYDSKESLREAASSVPRVNSEYELKKYCKFPVVSDNEDKEYISLKPKDKINIVWEHASNTPDGLPVAVKVEITFEDDETKRVMPCWGKSKLITWIQNSTVENN